MFTSITNQDFWATKACDDLLEQENGCSLGVIGLDCLGFNPFREILGGHYNMLHALARPQVYLTNIIYISFLKRH